MKAQFVLFALLLAAAPSARAELRGAKNEAQRASTKSHRKAKKKAQPDSVLNQQLSDVSVPMAHGELQAEVAADVAQRERANAPRTLVEVAASTWKPSRVTTGSRIAGTTDFATKGIPATSVSFLSPIAGRVLYAEFGLGFLPVERSATLETGAIRVPQTQNGYIGTVRLGVQAMPWLLFGDRLLPYASAAALPSLLVTRRSAFDDGVSDTGVPFELGAGAIVRISRPLSLDVGVHQVLGRVQDSDFQGFGAKAGVRIQI